MSRSKKFQGCDEDCFNCPYPDCFKPPHQMKPLNDITNITRVNKVNGESQGRMFTVELGKYNGVNPNIKKKFYL